MYLFLQTLKKNSYLCPRMRTKSLLTILLTACALQSFGLDFFSRKFNSANGLPDNNVRSLVTDNKGYLWVGTTNGLYRYDGYFFTTYKCMDEGNSHLLSNNHISGLYALNGGQSILVSEQGGLYSVFDTDLARFVEMPAEEKERLYEDCRKIAIDSAVAKRFSTVLRNEGTIINDNLGNMVVLDNTGQIWHIDKASGETVRLRVFSETMWPLVSSKKIKVVASPDGRLLWVSTNGCGITVYDRVRRQQQSIRLGSGLVSTDNIVDICLADNQSIWICDEFHGVVLLSVAEPKAQNILLFPEDKSLRRNQVYIMHWQKDSTLLVANVNGDVFWADSHLNLQPMTELTGLDIHSLCYDHQGNLWIGSRQQGIRTPDGQWHKHQPTAPGSLSANNVYAMTCDSQGRIWAACEGGHLDLVSWKDSFCCRHFFKPDFSPRVIMQDKRGQIWVGTKTELYRFVPEELMADTSAYQCLLSATRTRYSDVVCLYEDSKGRIWVGTQGCGLFYTDDGESFSSLTQNDGLISNEVQSVVEDGDGRIWIGTKNGLTCYHPEEHIVTHFYDDYNLMRNYYTNHCACLLPDGRLAFGTNCGIVVYDSRQPTADNAQATTFRITDLLINGESVSSMGDDSPLQVAPDLANEVRLAHDQNSLTIRFSAFNFNTAFGTRYTYWLEGYDRQWSEVSTYSFANYKNLPPGRYVFHVKAFDNHSSSNAERTLTIVVRHPWWQTWWAYLIYILVATIVGLLIVRQLRTVYRLRRRISIEQQLTEFKLQFFTNISHEFRTPLTIIRGATDRMQATKNIPGELRQPVSSIQRSTNRMLRLINQLLEFRKMQNGKLRLALEQTDVVAFVKDICQNFRDMADGKQIAYTFLPSVKSYLMYIDRQHVDKIIYNLLSNAFKYTPTKGSVKVVLRVEEPWLTIRVEDTGVGIPREKQSELFQRFMQSTFSNDSIGIGLHLTKALVDVHHGDIRFEENQPQGSVFILSLPTDKGVYREEDFLQTSSLQADSTQATTTGTYQELMAQPMNDRKILVVEDDADVADFLRQTLGRYFEVEVAMDGSDALTRLADGDYSLVVSDVMMPVMDGFELTTRIRKNPATVALPVILLTALNSDEKRLKGIKHGADAYLTKPFDTRLLITTCRNLIEQRDRLRQTFADTPASQPSAPPEIIVDERDRQFFDVLQRWLYDHLSTPTLSVDDMADAMGYGRSVFYRKVKSLTGQTPADYVRTLRMNRAAEMLRDETVTVAEVAYKVGISEPHYFTKVFKQQFGISPKKYQQGKRPEEAQTVISPEP